MNLFNSPKRSIISFLILFCMSLFIGCHKENNPAPGGTIDPSDLTTKVTASVISGFVTDEYDTEVMGAIVQAGGVTTTTDKYGYFEIRNVQVVQNAATVTIVKAGYFKGVKTYIATADKSAFFRIKLSPKTNVGTFNAGSGGTFIAAIGSNNTLSTGCTVSIPPNAVVNAITNTAYTGSVNVSAELVAADDPDVNKLMPGDLRGLTAGNDLRILTSYGMMAVELTGTGGELLQIAAGKKATLIIPIPASLQARAPASITLWSFNESNGLWKEDGGAIKTGNTYVANVTHFSFWDWGMPATYVQFNCRIVDQSGKAIPNTAVRLVDMGPVMSVGYGYTDSTGFVAGPIPANAQIQMEVYTDACVSVMYSKKFTTANVDISLGTIDASSQMTLANVSGTVTTCTNTPLTNGYIIVDYGNNSYRYNVNNGTFSFNIVLCPGYTGIGVTAVDISSQQQLGGGYNLIAGNNAIGNIKACPISSQRFVNYTINGTQYSFTPPADSLFSFVGNPVFISGYKITAPGNKFSFEFSNSNLPVGSNHNLIKFAPSQIPDSLSIITPIAVNVTEYGAIGQYIAGTFTGTLRGKAPANIQYNVTLNFRVER